MLAFREYLNPPQISNDPAEQQKAAILHHMSLYTNLAAFAALFYFGFFNREYSDLNKVLLMTLLVICITLVCYVLLRAGRTRLTAKILVISLSVLLVVASHFENGLLSFEIYYLIAPIGFAFLTLDRRWGVLTALFAVASAILIGALNINGVIAPPPDEPLNVRVVEALVHLLIMLSVISMYFYTSKRAMDTAHQQMVAKEQRVRQMLDLMTDATLQMSLDGTVTAINRRATAMLGYSSADIIGKNSAILTEGRTPEEVHAIIETLQLNVPLSNRLPILHKDGHELIGERRAVKMDLDGELIVFVTIRDVTEEIAVQERLAASQAELSLVSERLALVADNVPALMSFVDRDETILFLNNAFERFNVNGGASIGKKLNEVFRPDVYAYLKPYLQQTFSSFEPTRFDLPVAGPKGSLSVIDAVHIPHVVDGEISGYIGLANDVTEERALVRALQESQQLQQETAERLQLVADHLPVRVAYIDRNLIVRFANQRYDDVINESVQAWVDRHVSELAHPDVFTQIEPMLNKALTGMELQFEITLPPTASRPMQIAEIIYVPHVSRDSVVGLVALSRDVTEERQLVRELTESKKLQEETAGRLQLIADHLPVRVAYIDRDERLLFVNRRYREEYVEHQVSRVGEFLKDIAPDGVYDQLRPNIQEALTGKEVQFEVKLAQNKDAPPKTVEVTYVPYMNQSEVVGLVGLTRDVTEERKQQAALRESQRLESLGLMAGGIAHDFNNLLSAILGQASIAKLKLPETHPAYKHVEKSVRAAERAGGLTNQMLAYSGRGQFEIRPINLTELIKDNLHLFESSIGKHIQLKLNFEENLPIIEADAAQMQQVVMNLILNATQAIDARAGQIELSTAYRKTTEADMSQFDMTGDTLTAGNYVSFVINDNGSGMSAQQREKIFEPFYSTKQEGSGLGLSAVLGIIRGHNGGIRVMSQEGIGTQFELLFPVSSAWLASGERDFSDAPTGKDVVLPGKVLVIDDEWQVSETVVDMLDMLGVESVIAVGGLEGLQIYQMQRDEICVVLLDLMMPEMDGEETFQRLRAMDPSVNVVITSGYSEMEAMKRFVGQDLAGFIQKPYQPDALFKKINDAFRKRAVPS